MRLNRVFRKAVSFVAAACMVAGSFTGIALADYANTGDVLDGWVCQVVVQNGNNDQNASLWMNDGVCESITYNSEQHVVLDPADGSFSGVEDVLNFAAIYFSYYGDYTGDAQFDVTLTNVTIYSNGYDAITLADYSSADAGTNYPSSSNDYAVRYDFQDQLDESTRTDVLRNLDRIEFDMVVSAANFSDAPQVEAGDADEAAAEAEDGESDMTYTELITTAGETSNIDILFFAMDANWTWMQPDGTVKLLYQTEDHATISVDGATAFADAVSPMQVIGFQIGYYSDYVPSDSYYDIQYTLTNVTMNFDTYESVVLGDISSEDMDPDTSYYNSGKFYFYSDSFPADADLVDMMQHLTSIEFDYYVSYVGATGMEGLLEEETSEETTEEETDEPEETEEETEAKEETEEETEAETEEATTEESTEAETESESDDSSNGDMVRTIVTVVAVVILLGALIVVAVMYVKRSKQI